MGFRAAGFALAAVIVIAGCGYDNGGSTSPSVGYSSGSLLGRAPNGDVRSSFQIVRGAGDITSTVAQFRTLLGDPSNGFTPGQQSSGRREINWDGVPAALTNVSTFPGDFFRKAGALFTTAGTGFRNSDNDFSDLNPAFGAQFEAFSKPKTFAPVGSPDLTVTFRVAGSDTPAAVTGFGIVFSDVDHVGSASIKLFDAQGRSLGLYHAPARTDEAGLSFVGVVFDAPIVARVEIAAGQAAIDAGVQDVSDGGNRDLVVTDNFLYGEPQALN